MPVEVAEYVLRRDGGCVAHRWGFDLDTPCAGRPHVHHRVLRSQGGKHTADNLCVLCSLHHLRAHDVIRAEANAAGIILRG